MSGKGWTPESSRPESPVKTVRTSGPKERGGVGKRQEPIQIGGGRETRRREVPVR